MSTSQQLTAVKALPPRLLRFFQRYPPPALFPNLAATTPFASAASAPAVTQATADIISESTTGNITGSTIEPTASEELPIIPIPTTAPRNSRVPPHAHDLPYPNPFLPSKNFTTGRWHGPVFGLRKQADLVKLAVAHDVVDLLPWTMKKPGEREARRIESGLRVKGTGEGQKVKGKSWERTLKGRLEMRRQAMLNMPQMIQEWKQVSYLLMLGIMCRVANDYFRKDMVVAGRNGQVERQRNKWSCWHGIFRVACVWQVESAFTGGVGASPIHCSIFELCVHYVYDRRRIDWNSVHTNINYDGTEGGILAAFSLLCNST